MTETELRAGFYNAIMVEGVPDRTYNADEMNDYLKGLISDNGIFANISTACQVVSGTGMQVIIKAGRGKVNNRWFKIESDLIFDISPADVILNRIDTIVVRHSAADRNVTLALKTGTLASDPTYELTRTNDIYEIALATIRVDKNTQSITDALITDLRPNKEVCGWITGLIEQVDTTTLFNQYEDAQNIFIVEKTAEFDAWFDGIKDDVRATSLYREYQAVYRTNIAGQTVITIPESINYVNNGLDILNVFINGMRLLKDVEYTINTSGTQITLATPLDVEKQDVEFVNKKSIDGTVAENVVVQVEALQEEVESLAECSYIATGANDNIAISNIVKNFLDGTEDYSTVADNANMTLNVIGTLGIGSLIEEQMVFDFHNTSASNRKITINFGNATIPSPTSPSSKINILAVFGMNEQVFVENANIKIDDYNATTLYCFHGGNIRNSKIHIDNQSSTSIYGMWNPEEASNNQIDIISSTNTEHGIYAPKRALFNNINVTNGWPISAEQGASNILIGNIGNATNGTFSDTIDIGNINNGEAG